MSGKRRPSLSRMVVEMVTTNTTTTTTAAEDEAANTNDILDDVDMTIHHPNDDEHNDDDERRALFGDDYLRGVRTVDDEVMDDDNELGRLTAAAAAARQRRALSVLLLTSVLALFMVIVAHPSAARSMLEKGGGGPLSLLRSSSSQNDDDAAAAAASLSSSAAAAEEATTQQQQPHSQQQQQPHSQKQETTPAVPLVYSNMATIVPDPLHSPIDDKTRAAITETFGKWHFWDGDEANRPQGDYCGNYPNRDIPGNAFPEGAWQADAVFVNHIIDDAEQLIVRTIEAIYSEYGWGKAQHDPDALATLLVDRQKLSRWDRFDDLSPDFLQQHGNQLPPPWNGRGSHGQGGWTTKRSWDGLIRRLLHAIMTNDTFTVVLGGHSAAAGHGNHFHQSYMMQFHKVMAPVFARLGVKLITRNLSQGGLGTIQNAMGMKSLYGDEIDLLLWDSGMTEGTNADIEYFMRQGLLSGNRVPVLWGGNLEVLSFLHEHVDADVGVWGTGMDGVPLTTSPQQVKTLPYAARYLKCSNDQLNLCKEDRYCAKCWIEREDTVPRSHFEFIRRKPAGQVRWHPGWRVHQLTGRVLALAVLDALQAAIQLWSDGTMGGPPLDDDYWHVTAYYENIRNKLKNLEATQGYCHEIENRLPPRVCGLAMQGRSLYTPRANPEETSLLTLIRPAPDGYKPKPAYSNAYDGPDLHNSCYDTPPGEVDVYAIVTNRRRRLLLADELFFSHASSPAADMTPWQQLDALSEQPRVDSHHPHDATTLRALQNADNADLTPIVTGHGWKHAEEYPGSCDGSYYGICARHFKADCPLLAHHDSRGFLVGDGNAGWLVLDFPGVQHGMIILKFYTYLKPEDAVKASDTSTTTTTTNNNATGERELVVVQQPEEYDGNDEETNAEVWIRDTDYVDPEYALDRLDGDDASSTWTDHNLFRRHRELQRGVWPDTFRFSYAINGVVKETLTRDEFMARIHNVQRVVEDFIVLNDPTFIKPGEPPQNVQVAIRIHGCGAECVLGFTHAYWA